MENVIVSNYQQIPEQVIFIVQYG